MKHIALNPSLRNSRYIRLKEPWKGPPLSIESTLHLAWGLTLTLSHEDTQQKLGSHFLELLGKIHEEYKSDIVAQKYLNNLDSILSRFLRNLGYEKDVYSSYLDTHKNKKEQIIQNTKDISDFTSLSSEGMVIRIASFFGIGSLTELAVTFGRPAQDNVADSLDRIASNLSNNATILEDRSGAAKVLLDAASAIKDLSNTLSSSQSSFPLDPAIFLGAGFIGMLAFSFVLKYKWRDWRIRQADIRAARELQRYWSLVTRPRYKAVLDHLCDDLALLLSEFYDGYSERILVDYPYREQFIDELIPAETLYELPPELYTAKI